MAVIGQKVSTRMFFFHKDDKMFTQEASSLRGLNITGQLYDDAADRGFVMRSHTTGNEIPFYLTGVERDSEGDIQCWNFKSASKNPDLANLTACVFND